MRRVQVIEDAQQEDGGHTEEEKDEKEFRSDTHDVSPHGENKSLKVISVKKLHVPEPGKNH